MLWRWTSSVAIGAVVIVAVMAAMSGGVRAQQLPLPLPDLPAATVRVEAPREGTLAHHVERDPQCPERSNGCEVCVRGQAGRASCSVPGIACQPGGWRCTRHDDEPLSGPKPRL